MTSQYRHRRTSNPATGFPSPIEPGEIAVNTANRQIAVGDAAAGSVGAPLPLLAVRIFDTRAQYVANDLVVQGGLVYRANGAISPGPFNAGSWTVMADPATYVNVSGDTMTGHLALPTGPAADNAVRKDYADTKVAKTGDAMTGFLTLHADPDAALKAATKQYVDSKSVYTPSGGIASNTIATAIAELDSEKVAKAGDTMTGALVVTPKGSTFGSAAGTIATGIVTQADANIMIYNAGGTNWSGIGADGFGNLWFRTGAVPSVPAVYIDPAQFLYLLNEPATARHAATKQYVDAYASPAKNRGHLAGLNITHTNNTITVGLGVAVDNNNTDFMVLLTAFPKQTFNPWTVGGSNGSMDVGGTVVANTWYHVHLIKRSDTGVVDFCLSTNPTAPTIGGAIPAAYTLSRRIGSFRTDGSNGVMSFLQNGDTFTWGTPLGDVNVLNPGTAAVARTMSTPLGVIVEGIFMVGFGAAALSDNPAAILLSNLATADIPPHVGTASFFTYSASALINNTGGQVRVHTNMASQIRSRVQASSTNTNLFITTFGWVDRRGRDA